MSKSPYTFVVVPDFGDQGKKQGMNGEMGATVLSMKCIIMQ